jgi:hypothetical protein
MDKRTTAIVATVATALLCGCPGLFALCWGVIAVPVSFMPGADINIGGSNDPRTALFSGIGALCIGLLFILIPVLVGYFTLRTKPAVTVVEAPSGEIHPEATHPGDFHPVDIHPEEPPSGEIHPEDIHTEEPPSEEPPSDEPLPPAI